MNKQPSNRSKELKTTGDEDSISDIESSLGQESNHHPSSSSEGLVRTHHRHPHLQPLLSTTNLDALSFPRKLHIILSTPEYQDIICWLPHGRAWRIQQRERLVSDILPKFFQHQKYSSFSRQVYGWGFHRITSGADYNSFFHELFLRDDPQLSFKMKRPSRTELTERRQSQPDTPPDFYSMPPVSQSNMENNMDDNQITQDSSSKISLDEYKEKLMRRLSTYSPREQNMFLQLELSRLKEKRKKVLEQLEAMGIQPPDGYKSILQEPATQSTVLEQALHPDPINLDNAFVGSLNPWIPGYHHIYTDQQQPIQYQNESPTMRRNYQ